MLSVADIEDANLGRAMSAMAADPHQQPGQDYVGRLKMPGAPKTTAFDDFSPIDMSLVPSGLSVRLPLIDNRSLMARMTSVDGQLVDFAAWKVRDSDAVPTFVDPDTGSATYALPPSPKIVGIPLPGPQVAAATGPGYWDELRASRQADYQAMQDEAVASASPRKYVAAKLASIAGDVGQDMLSLGYAAYSLTTNPDARALAVKTASYVTDHPEVLAEAVTDSANRFIQEPGSEKAYSLAAFGLGIVASAGAGRLVGWGGELASDGIAFRGITSAAPELQAFSRIRYSTGLLDKSFDPLPVDQGFLDQFVRTDPALSSVKLSARPVISFDLPEGTVGRSRLAYDMETNTFAKISEIGPEAFDNRSELVGTVVHEETHLRFGDKLQRNSERFIQIDSAGMEENYVIRVEQRFLRMQSRVGR